MMIIYIWCCSYVITHLRVDVGLNIEQVEFQGFNLTFWDVGGQAVRLWKHYFDSIDAIIYVIDSTDKERC